MSEADREIVELRREQVRRLFLLALLSGEHGRARAVYDCTSRLDPELAKELSGLEAEIHTTS